MSHKKIKIETYWNVNKDGCEYVAVDFTIKIETYWNVNCHEVRHACRLVRIKIETYWNVNASVVITVEDKAIALK